MQRSLAYLRELGWTAEIVERWNPHAKVRHDLFGFGDILAIQPGKAPLIVQTTTCAHMAERIAKIQAEPRCLTWRAAGGDIVVHGWGLKGPSGARKVWTLSQVHIR